MALSGYVTGYSSNQYIDVQISWAATQDKIGNTSTVSAFLRARRNNTGYVTSGSLAGALWLDGSSVVLSGQRSISTDWVDLGSITKTIPHNSDGTESFAVAVSGGALSGSGWTFSVADTRFTLDTIPRASSLSFTDTLELGSPLAITVNRPSSSFTHTLKYVFGSASGTIATGVTTSTSWTPPLSLAEQIPNSATGSATIECETYSGGTLIGTSSKKVTLTVPASVVPTLASMTISDTSNAATIIGAWVQNVSAASITLGASAGVHGSSIVSQQLVANGVTIDAGTGVIPITQTGAIIVTGTVTDSRGRTATRTQILTVLPYTKPVFATPPSLQRATSAGVADTLGTYLKTVIDAAATSLKVGGAEKNTLTVTVKTRPAAGSVWTPLLTHIPTSLTSGYAGTIGGSIGIDSGYLIQIDATDKIATSSVTVTIPTAQVTMSWGKTGIGVSKIWEQGALDVAGPIYQNGGLLGNLYGPGKFAIVASQGGVEVVTDLPATASYLLVLTVRKAFLLAGSAEADRTEWALMWTATGVDTARSRGVAQGGQAELHTYAKGGVVCFWIPAASASSAVLVDLALLNAGSVDPAINHRIVTVTATAKPTAGVARSSILTANSHTHSQTDIYLTGSAGSGVRYRRIGNEIQITTSIYDTHTITPGGVTLGTMPAGLRPASSVAVAATTMGAAGIGQLAINPAGVVTAWSFSGNTTYFGAQLRYPI